MFFKYSQKKKIPKGQTQCEKQLYVGDDIIKGYAQRVKKEGPTYFFW